MSQDQGGTQWKMNLREGKMSQDRDFHPLSTRGGIGKVLSKAGT